VREPLVFADAIVRVHHEIAGLQFLEGRQEGRGLRLRGAGAVDLAAEDLLVGDHDQRKVPPRESRGHSAGHHDHRQRLVAVERER